MGGVYVNQTATYYSVVETYSTSTGMVFINKYGFMCVYYKFR